MEKRITHADGSTTVITDSYGFGSIVVGPPTRREKTEAEREREEEADRMTFEELGMSPDELTQAQALGFPARSRYTHSWRGQTKNFYSRRSIKKFFETYGPIARKLLALEAKLTK
jgi:hypothetical protein